MEQLIENKLIKADKHFQCGEKCRLKKDRN
jgi:hypothetical protein